VPAGQRRAAEHDIIIAAIEGLLELIPEIEKAILL
jgi:hypothetical protein